MHNSKIYVFFLLVSSYMFWCCHHLQRAYITNFIKTYSNKLLIAVAISSLLLYVFQNFSLMLYVLMKFWCKLLEDGDNPKTCRS